MDEGAVDPFEGDLDEVLVGAVDGVARLEADDRAPAALGEGGARLGGGEAVLGEVPVVGKAQGLDGAAEHEVAGGVERGDARVGLVGGAVDLLGEAGLVAPVDLLDVDDAEGESLLVAQVGADARRQLAGAGLGHGQGDGHGPGEPVRQRHVLDDGVVVGLAHEAGEGAEAAVGKELEVGQVPGVELDRGEVRDLPTECHVLFVTDEEVDEGTAVRFAEVAHDWAFPMSPRDSR